MDEIADINPSSDIPDRFYYIDLESVTSGSLTSPKIIEKEDAPSRAQRLILQYDILFQTVRPYQQNNYLASDQFDLPAVASTGYAQIRTKHNSHFLYSLLHTNRFLQEVLLRCTGSNYPAINSNDLKEIAVYYPSCGEQDKIALFMALIEKRIEKQRQLVEALKSYKRGALSKLFPKKGESAPQYRFAGFTKPWTQRKLGEVGKARSGVGFPDTEQGGKVGFPFFKVSDMNNVGNESEMTTANNYVTDEQIASHRWRLIKDLPAIFFAKVGAAVMLNRKRLCLSPFLLDNNTMAYSLNPKAWNADFAKALFETIDLTSLVQVGALPSYNTGDLEVLEISLPELKEQEQIGAFFLSLDNLITLHQCELNEFQESKSGLLQQLFI